MKRVLYIICVIATIYQSACQQKMICPAYHSYFILDVEETRKTFTLFGADSLPRKKWDIEKEKYGIAKEISDKKKLNEMRIISMNSIYKKIDDPYEMFKREYAGSDSTIIMDSASVYADTQNYKDFQNIDQMIYLHHFGKYLPRRGGTDEGIREDLRKEEPIITEEIEEDQPKKKRKFWPFGKKNKKSKKNDLDDSGEEEQ